MKRRVVHKWCFPLGMVVTVGWCERHCRLCIEPKNDRDAMKKKQVHCAEKCELRCAWDRNDLETGSRKCRMHTTRVVIVASLPRSDDAEPRIRIHSEGTKELDEYCDEGTTSQEE